MSEPTIIISLMAGDWSGDGHDKRETVNIKSNLDKKAMEKAYKKATKKLGFDFCNDICAEYEDQNLPKEKLDILIAHGLKTDDMDIEYDIKQMEKDEEADKNWIVSLYTNDFVEIYLFIVSLGNTEFKYEFLDEEVNPVIHIGGYGMFT